MRPGQPYWFPAKRYGWGWGFPIAWQGRLALAILLAFLVAGSVFILPRYSPLVYVAYSVVLGLLQLGVCWLKGEPPRWRWGDDDPKT